MFDQRGFTERRDFFSDLPFEHIDPLTGNLLLTFTDLVLPGNAGFDLKIQRTYNSKIWRDFHNLGETLDEDSWAGVGWTLHLGRVFRTEVTDTSPPIIEMPDGSRHATSVHISAPPGCSSCYITRDYWVYDKNTRLLKLPNGVVYDFEHSGPGGSLGAARYATSITDPFGNSFTITYKSDPADAIDTIVQDLGSGQSRTISFTTNPTYRSLATMTYSARTWTYTQQAAAGAAFFSLLTEADPPTGPSWQYAYNTTTTPRNELTSLTTPQGGVIGYAYANKTFKLGSTIPVTTRVVSQRQTSGRDITAATWAYAYAQGSGENQTVITAPASCGGATITYTFLGVGNFTFQGAAWRVGLQQTRVVRDGGITLETEDTEWQASQAISNDDEMIGFNVDTAIYVPLLDTRTITRGSRTSTQDHAYQSTNFNDYGRPYQTVESGELTRTITRTFQYGFSGYIVDKVASEAVTGGGESFTTSHTYNTTTGFVLSRSVYGVTSTYAPTTRGNILKETNARGFDTDYTYSWGRVASIATPQYTISRTINQDGTIASETRRGFQTTFTHDALMRPLVTDPPAGNDVVRSYAANGETETITRGSSSTVTTLDGFGRVSATLNNVGVRTEITYDACGRRTYESFPYTTTNIGTTIQYDPLDRVTRRTHPDAKFQAFSYSNGIDVTITDENSHTTVQNWSGFADPDDKRLVSVTDASTQVTSYTYNIVGSLRTVGGVAGSREWVYNTKNQLVSESHPENGVTQYGRDPVGNMSSRTDAIAQVTNFTYDGNNRLTAIDHPGTAHDVSIGYDASDNRTALGNGFVSSTLAYDSVNRLTSRTDVIGSRSFSTGYLYDDNDNISRIDYPSGRAVAYGYDAENRITSVTNGSTTTYANNFSYHPSGQIASYTAGNALVHTRTFDNRYRVSTLNAGGALSLTYGYDDVGNVSSIDDSRSGFDQGFSYDPLDRLTSHTGWNAASYTYDGIGNRTSKSGPGGTTNYDYHVTTKRLSTATGAQAESFGHDANGNLTSDGAGTYTHTTDNMLETATIAGVATTYRYDGDNLRALKVLAGSTRYFVHGPAGALISEFEEVCSQLGPSRDYIFAGTQLIASVRFPALVATTAVTTTASSRAENLATASIGVSVTTSTGGSLACAVTVQYTTAGGTAAAGSDFTTTTGTLTFNAGSASGTTQTVSVPLTGDALDENDETFTLTLTGATGATLGASTHTVTITDDDLPPTIAVNDVTVVEGDSTASAVFTLTLSAASGRTLSINYATSNGAAVAGSDYTAASGTVSFDPGTTSRTVAVTVLGDTIEEAAEAFAVTLSNAVNVTIADGAATGSITDDDFRPAASIGDVTVTEGHSGTTSASFAVTLAAASSRTITISYATANATAVAGRDYTAASGTVTFAPGVTSQPVVVSVLGDAVVEHAETFTVSLSNPVWATLGDAQGAGTITTDDAFTDEPLAQGVTAVRAVHLTELRANIDLLRAAYGLGAMAWTDPTITPGVTVIQGVHLTQLRSALNAVYGAAGVTPPAYTDPTITGTVTLIRAVHIDQLRAAVKAVP